ncbi:MAG: hypothetical protein VR75_02275 [Hyphomonadaceae bacterium BRH_c29]|jgi:hypothetical protein|nr:MAG: hypothetical protein VR75_02275 [Hyphomonadaceae bacterium BRH_c29]
MSEHKDMCGLWSGTYRNDRDGTCVSFSAMFTEANGQLCGTTLEPATFGPLLGCDFEYEATVRGDRCGQHILLTKRFVPSTGILQPEVFFVGAVDASFTRFTGRWAVSEQVQQSGTFTLTRVATRTRFSLAAMLAAGA